MHRTFAAVLVAVLAVVLALGAGGCRQEPQAAFEALVAAADRGDVEAFMAGLTERSRKVMRGIVATVAPEEAAALLLPVATAGGAPSVQVTGARLDQKGTARLQVRTIDGEQLPVILIEEDGQWRVDLVECERLWSRLRLERELDRGSGLR